MVSAERAAALRNKCLNLAKTAMSGLPGDHPIWSRMTRFGVAVERRFSVQAYLAATRSLRLDKPLKLGISSGDQS
jgi:hypothetical protein